MAQKQDTELHFARRLFDMLGFRDVTPTPSDRPDVLATLPDCRVGIEVTELHPGEQYGPKGSPLRNAEKKKPKDRPYAMAAELNYLPAFRLRVEEKVAIAREYDNSRYDEL